MRNRIMLSLRKLLSLAVAVTLVLSILPAGGIMASSTEKFTVSDADDLDELAKMCLVDENSVNLEVVLTKDISLVGRTFVPIPYFSGVFDGHGHTIRSLAIRSGGSTQGLFRYVGKGALIRDLNVEGRIEPGKDAAGLGGIAGHNEGTIKNCTFNGSIRASEDAGGIVGINASDGTVSGCIFYGKVIAQHRAGGIAGENDGSIVGCTNDGEVNTEYIETDEQTKSSIASNLTNLSSFDVSTVSAEDFVDIMDIGGIAGYSTGMISECLGRGTVGYAHTGYNVGGIAGRSTGFIVNSTNSGAVAGRKDVGGIAGQLEPESIWEYSRSQVQDLKDQLIHLNDLIDTLAGDLSDSTADIRDDIETASGFAKNTISDLQGITDEVGDDAEKTSAAINQLTDQLDAAFDENNAQAAGDALKELAQVVSETDFFSIPVYVNVKGNRETDLNSVLDARESDWWKKLDDYLNSREQSIGQSISSGAQRIQDGIQGAALPNGGIFDAGPSESPAADAGEYSADIPAVISGDGGVISDNSGDGEIVPDEDYAPELFGAADEPSGDAAPDASSVQEPAYDEDDYAAQAEPALSADDYPAEAEPDYGADTLSDNVVYQDSDMTGAGDDELIVEESGSDGQEVFGYSSDIEKSVAVGDKDIAGSAKTSDVQVDVGGGLPDTSRLRALLSRILTDSSSILDAAALSNAAQIMKELQIKAPDTGSFYENFQGLASSVTPIADSVHNLSKDAAKDIDAVTDQLDRIIETFFDLTQNISLDETYTETDVSDQDPYKSDSASVDSCRNTGEINGDTNTGGITGCIGFENKIDAEGVLDVSKYLLKNARYTIFASERRCVNQGAVTAKKESAGGICGNMEFGIITDCTNTGAVRVQDGDFCGGICGKSQGTITDCCAGSLVSGGAYVGGIAGEGNAISSCVSYSYIGDSTEYYGAVAGWADGTVTGCQYVDYGVGGIDNVGYADSARPVSAVRDDASAASGAQGTGTASSSGTQNTAGAASSETGTSGGISSDTDSIDISGTGSTCTVTFIVDGEEYRQVRVPFGGSLESLPEVPNRGSDYWVWDDFDTEHIFSSQSVTGSYHRATTTLAAGGDVPDYLVEGTFYEGQELTAVNYVPEESPVSTESITSIIEDRIRGTEAADKPGDETETESDRSALAQAGQEIKRVITDRLTGPLLDAKTLTVNDYGQDLKARVRLQSGGRLFTTSDDGTLTETAYTKDGSYIVFNMKNGGSFAYYESLKQNKDARGMIAVILIIIAAACLAVIFLIRKRRKKKKQKNGRRA